MATRSGKQVRWRRRYERALTMPVAPAPAVPAQVPGGRRRVLAVVVGVVVAWGLVMASAACASTYSVHEAMSTLHSQLSEHPHLEGFAGYTAPVKQQLEKGLGIDEYLNQQYRSGSSGELITHYGLELDEAGQNTVKSYGDTLVQDARAVPDAGVTDAQIGGETLDAAVGEFGIEGLAAAEPVIPVAFGTGYFIGERLMEVWGGAGETSEPSAGTAINSEAWLRVVLISGHTSTLSEEISSGGPHNPWEEGAPVVGPGGAIVKTEWQGNGYFPGPAPPPPVTAGNAYYALAFRTEGSSYYAITGPSAKLSSLGYQFGDYTEEYAEEGCTETDWIDPPHIAGWPPHLSHASFVESTERYEARCTPWRKVLVEQPTPHYEREYLETRIWLGLQTYYWRSASQIGVSLPKPTTKCSGECSTYSIPALPSIGTLAEHGASAFPGGSEGNPHRGAEEWLETYPLSGETPVVMGAVTKEVAGSWKEQHPSPGEEEVPTERMEEDAKECVNKVAAAAEDGGDKCKHLSVFLPGSDVKEPAEHDQKAIAAYPAWTILNYESRAAKEGRVPRNWYESVGGCPGTKEAEDQCDEYPFFSSVQGGPEEGAKPQASLEYVNGPQNEAEGRKYASFLGACKIEAGDAFIVEPNLSAPTTRLCNK